jgi:flagellar FliL protein
MSEETPPAEAPAKKPSRGVVIAAVAGAVAAGIGVGAVAIGPMLAKPAAAHGAAPTKGGEAEGEHGPEADTAIVAAAPLVLNNVVLNPAGSRGTRFLLVSVGFEFAPAVTPEEFANSETKIRDAVIGTLSARTVDELVDYTRRDGIRTEIAGAVDSMFAGRKVRRVFFPQFVIQ